MERAAKKCQVVSNELGRPSFAGREPRPVEISACRIAINKAIACPSLRAAREINRLSIISRPLETNLEEESFERKTTTTVQI